MDETVSNQPLLITVMTISKYFLTGEAALLSLREEKTVIWLYNLNFMPGILSGV